MATEPTEEAPGTLKYQTWVLKVLIHCEGCRKKVKKVLQNIEGVYTTEVDLQQHKVTVTGNVEAETLLKKLLKSGKQAELWPEVKKAKKSGKSKNNSKKNEKQPEDHNHEQDGDHDQPDKTDSGESDAEGGERNEAGGESGTSPTVGAGGGNSASTGAKKKKKKKKKAQNGNSPTGGGANLGEKIFGHDPPPAGSIEPYMAGGPDMNQPMASMNLDPPVQHTYPGPYPTSMYYPPPTYGLSYNTAYPNSTSTSYFAPEPMHSTTYSQPGMFSFPLPSYSIDDDDKSVDGENGSGCYIM